MRNLKKILALALALSMMFSMMVSASAAFTDADQIDADYAEAVQVLSGLGVFKGFPAGDFQPKGTITREEVAAIIYRIATGDVKDEKAALYVGTANFSDVKATDWSAGYIGYCANAGYVKGMGDGTFAPQGKVTGMQALAMVLRALGYDAQGEFTGLQWESNIARVATQKGILKGVNPGVLSQAASRELVAQLLFAAIAKTNTVSYNLVLGYQENKTTLGYDTFDLVELDGVLTANEYADLNDDDVLAAGKIEIDGVGYNWAGTTLEQIGLAVKGWAADGDVLYFAEGKNTVEEYTAAKKLSKFDMDFAEDVEYFENYEPTAKTVVTADMKIKYQVSYEKPGTEAGNKALWDKLEANKGDKFVGKLENNTTDGTYDFEKTIKNGATLTATDLEILADIFGEADYIGDHIFGAVFVGTQSAFDVSDYKTYKQFVAEYLTIEEFDNTKTFTASDNGEVLKAIDNDGDGEADLIFLNTYNMAAITKVASSGDLTINDLKDGKNIVIDADDMITEDELAKGDVIVYTLIDGLYTVNKAEVVTDTINKKGIDFKAETVTCGETVYEQSGIDISANFNAAFLYDTFETLLVEAATQVTYDFYLDNFGYVRAFTENKHSYGLGLLTDAYYWTDLKDTTAKVDMIVGAEEEATYIASTKSSTDWNDYIDYEAAITGDRGTWGRLNGFVGAISKDADGKALEFWTNVAAYAIGEETTALYDVVDYTNRDLTTEKAELKLTDKTGLKTSKLTAVPVAGTEKLVYATTDTVYYYVTKNSSGDIVAKSWVGYENAPSGLSLDENVDRAYAVYTETLVGKLDYNYADVIVIESTSALKETTFVYYANGRYADAPHYSYWLETIGYDADAEKWESDVTINVSDKEYQMNGVVKFYEINAKDDVLTPVEKNFADHNIFASTVVVAEDVYGRDKAYLADNTTFKPSKVDIFELGYSSTQTNSWLAHSVSAGEISDGDKVIYVTDDYGYVEYIINVTDSVYGDSDTPIKLINDLYDVIVADYNYVPEVQKTDYELAVEQAKAAKTIDELIAADKALDDLGTLTDPEQDAYRAKLVADILAAAKVAKKLEIDATDIQGFTGKDTIKGAIAAAKDAIDNVTDVSKINSDLEDEIAHLEYVIKDWEIGWRRDCKAMITFDASKYAYEDVETLNAAKTKALNALDAATTMDAMDAAVKEFKDTLAATETGADKAALTAAQASLAEAVGKLKEGIAKDNDLTNTSTASAYEETLDAALTTWGYNGMEVTVSDLTVSYDKITVTFTVAYEYVSGKTTTSTAETVAKTL